MSGDFPQDRPAAPAFLTVPLSHIYGWLAGRYHRSYDNRRAFRAPVPVISVGNIAVGGTGKTPFVIALAKLIAEMSPPYAEQNAIAILSRGYGRESRELVVVEPSMNYRETGDEPLLIKKALPHASVVVHPDRAHTARFATEKLGARLLILDDGFQYRRLARDLDLVLLDGANPLGNGFLLPAGPLREPPDSLKRASAIFGVGSDTTGAENLVKRFNVPFRRVIPRLILHDELSTDLSTPSFLLTSIARPQRVNNMLINKGMNIVDGAAFRDHHRFRRADLTRIVDIAGRTGAKRVITTAKDRVRIPEWDFTLPLLVADVEIEFSETQEVKKLLEPVLSPEVKKVT